jgi:hypothetical protein
MTDLFRDFWWLLFPISWMAFSGYRSWLKAAARRDVLDTLKTFAAAGREPPAELVAKLDAR